MKAASRSKTRGARSRYADLLTPLPDEAAVSPRLRAPVDIIRVFAEYRSRLSSEFQRGLREIRRDGAIWLSWPKKASGVSIDLRENVVREPARPLALVDVAVCAVDDTWSGLKLVIRRSPRK